LGKTEYSIQLVTNSEKQCDFSSISETNIDEKHDNSLKSSWEEGIVPEIWAEGANVSEDGGG
jgi:hypothetical protein